MGTPTKAIVCPDCGLALRVTREAAGSTLTYDLGAWQRRCKLVELDDPAWCLVQRDGPSAKSSGTSTLSAVYPDAEGWLTR